MTGRNDLKFPRNGTRRGGRRDQAGRQEAWRCLRRTGGNDGAGFFGLRLAEGGRSADHHRRQDEAEDSAQAPGWFEWPHHVC